MPTEKLYCGTCENCGAEYKHIPESKLRVSWDGTVKFYPCTNLSRKNAFGIPICCKGDAVMKEEDPNS